MDKGIAAAPHEGRSEQRSALRTLLVGRLILADGREALCRIRNLSSAGMMIETPAALTRDGAVAVELREERFSGRVVWVHDGQAGLHFDTMIDVGRALGEARIAVARQDRPRAPRFRVGRRARISHYGRSTEVVIVDLSQSGACLGMEEPMAPDTEFTLAIPGLPAMACRTRWADADRCGVIFQGILPYNDLAAWLEEV
ncbi:MAG: PilZ domain-containing protein [Sphingomonas bacterium]